MRAHAHTTPAETTGKARRGRRATAPACMRAGGGALAPRSTMVHASPSATPEKCTSLSSPIMISSITLQRPSLTASGVSNVDAISPPAHGGDSLHCHWQTYGHDFLLSNKIHQYQELHPLCMLLA